MDFLHAFFLGAIQGLTEFLPVSSSSHLIIIPKIFNLQYFGEEFDVFLNLGSLMAVVLFFRMQVFELIIGLIDFITQKQSSHKDFFVTIFLSSLPAIIAGGILELICDVKINSMELISFSMIVFGVILYLCDSRQEKHDLKNTKPSRTHSIIVGFAQTAALVQGVSRLGACLSMMRFLQYSRFESFRFCMLLSIPPSAGACFLKLLKVISGNALISVELPVLFIGISSAFVFGMISIFCMCKFLKTHSFKIFALYRIIFGICIALFLQ